MMTMAASPASVPIMPMEEACLRAKNHDKMICTFARIIDSQSDVSSPKMIHRMMINMG